MTPSLRFLLLLGCGAAALLAEDFWVAKPYTEWSGKEIARLATNSPWAKGVSVPLGGGGGRGGPSMGSAAALGDASGEGGGGRGGGRRGGSGGDTSEAPGAQQVRAAAVTIRWQTALPIRQASIVDRYGAEKAASEEARKFLEQEPPDYVVGVIGLPASMVRAAAETLKGAASLEIKGRAPITAANIQVQTRGDAADLFIFFPKAAPLTLADKEVEFKCKLGRTEIQKKFKLKDMAVAGKLEL